LPLPSSLAGRTVEINDAATAPLLFVSPGQINLQLPWETPLGSQRLAVRRADTGELIAGGPLLTASASPGFFLTGVDGSLQAVALNEDGRANSRTNAAARRSIVTLFGTGQGEVSPAVQSGDGAPANAPAHTVAAPTADGVTCLTQTASVCVAVGSTFAEVFFSGLAPGLAGVWQINLRIPQDALTGEAVPVRAVIGGRPSNIVTIAVQ
jgi:uncharacterized protein (TIGR03437 family)